MNVNQVFVATPLTAGMLEQLAKNHHAKFEQITLGSLKNRGIQATLKLLRSVTEMQVVLEDPESERLKDVFLILFFFTKAKHVEFIRNDLSRFSLGRLDMIRSFVKTGWATLLSLYYALKSFLLSKMIKAPRAVAFGNSNTILYLKTNFWFGIKAGGSVAHVEGVISGLNQHGYQVDYAAVDCSDSLAKQINKNISLPIPKYLSMVFSTNLFIFDHLIYHDLAKQQFGNYRFIYHRMALNSLAAIRLAKKLKIPLILEYNGSEVWVQRHWGKPLFLESISKSVENACLHYADYIVTISAVLQQELISRGLPAEKIICYPNCVDPKKYNASLYSAEQLVQTRKQLGFTQQDVILTFVGTFGQWHGVDILAKIILNLYEHQQDWLQQHHVKFLLVGDGLLMPTVKQILSAIPNYLDFVKLVGLIPQNEAPKYLALSDILLSPHAPANPGEKFFGSPTKLFEYMAMKKLIIASDLDQIAEVLAPAAHIKDINTLSAQAHALLCEPGNVEQFSQAIKYGVENRADLNFMAENAYRKVLKEYTWEKHVEVILNKLEECSPSVIEKLQA